ncbi:hypothetical protein D0Z07_8078 [Hyphodiscus hymeniophilus]|uniref:Uncharacterized protein n=1 Tax=Hyphodiscus hymeniophilus TaxID=353542 RepID=A0A9P6SL25_9HELO|nr:hypothetical protein D0Z07_8078 [Hyphodiscus hymeniophilus]
MASRGRFHPNPNAPNLDPDSSMIPSKSKAMVLPQNALSPQLHAKNLLAGATNLMQKHQSLSSPPSAKSLRSRRMLEELIGENSLLRAEVEKTSSQQATALERMITDLVKIKSELRAKDVKIADQQQVIHSQVVELTQLRADADNALLQSQKPRLEENDNPKTSQLQQTISELTTEMREKDLNMREKDQMLREREFEIRSMKGHLELQMAVQDQDQIKRTSDDTQLESERAKVSTFQEEIRTLKTGLAALESQLHNEKVVAQQYRDELSQSQTTQDAAHLAVNAEKTRGDKYLQDIDQQNAAYRQLRSQLEAQEAKNLKLTQELNHIHDKSHRDSAELRDQMQLLVQREQEHAQDVAEARQTMNYFKRNSEASSKKVKGLEAEVKSLMQSLEMTGGVQMANPLTASSHMTQGAWPDTDNHGKRSSTSLRRKPLANI